MTRVGFPTVDRDGHRGIEKSTVAGTGAPVTSMAFAIDSPLDIHRSTGKHPHAREHASPPWGNRGPRPRPVNVIERMIRGRYDDDLNEVTDVVTQLGMEAANCHQPMSPYVLVENITSDSIGPMSYSMECGKLEILILP